MGPDVMFAAGALGASWLWVLALVVARYYGTWRRWWGWAELHQDGVSLVRFVNGDAGASSRSEAVAIMAMLVYAAGLVGFVLHAQFS